MKLIFPLYFTLVLSAACSSKPVLASEKESDFVAEITFSKEKAFISDEARKELKALHQKAAAKGKIDEIKVITWADQEYPSIYEKKISESQQNLVKLRNDAMERYLDELSGDDDAHIETFSMAERPDALNKLFSSDDAQIKKSLETAGIPNTDTTVKVPGKASKSVVIFIMEEE